MLYLNNFTDVVGLSTVSLLLSMLNNIVVSSYKVYVINFCIVLISFISIHVCSVGCSENSVIHNSFHRQILSLYLSDSYTIFPVINLLFAFIKSIQTHLSPKEAILIHCPI